MEMNQQVSTLQDEVRLLKGEIKSILKELRTAVLSRDNPFSADASLPAFRGVDRSEPAGSDAAADKPNVPLAAPEPPTAPPNPTPPPNVAPAGPMPGVAPAGPASPPDVAPADPLPPSGGATAAPMPPSLRTASEGAARPALTIIRPLEEEDEGPPAQRWNLLTIASLAAWVEEAVETLGSKTFQTVLELSCFADILTPEMRNVLSSIGQVAPQPEEEGQPMNINECLVVLRQLEAILHGGGSVERHPVEVRRAA